MDKLVVVGVDTIAGAGIAQALKDRTDLLGIAFHGTGGAAFATKHVRRGDGIGLAAAIEGAEPDCLIYAGPLSAANWDLPAADPAWEHEPAMAEGLVAAARRLNAKLIAISSDAVFGGPKLFHDESEEPAPTHPAAETIVECEQVFIAGGALVARTHVYGWAPAGSEPGLVEQIAQSLLDGLVPPVDGWRYATPLLATDLAEFLLRAAERTNPYRLAGELARILGVAMPRNLSVHLTPPSDSGWLLETSLDSRRIRRALDMPLPLLGEGLRRFAEQRSTRAATPGTVAQQAA